MAQPDRAALANAVTQTLRWLRNGAPTPCPVKVPTRAAARTGAATGTARFRRMESNGLGLSCAAAGGGLRALSELCHMNGRVRVVVRFSP